MTKTTAAIKYAFAGAALYFIADQGVKLASNKDIDDHLLGSGITTITESQGLVGQYKHYSVDQGLLYSRAPNGVVLDNTQNHLSGRPFHWEHGTSGLYKVYGPTEWDGDNPTPDPIIIEEFKLHGYDPDSLSEEDVQAFLELHNVESIGEYYNKMFGLTAEDSTQAAPDSVITAIGEFGI